MVQNLLGPYLLKMPYTVDNLQHLHQMNLNVDGSPVAGVDMGSLNGVSRDGTLIDMTIVIETYLGHLADMLSSATSSFGSVELWKVTGVDEIQSFITSYTPIQQPTGAGSYRPAKQATFTFRSVEGGIGKIVLLDTVFDRQDKAPLAGEGGAVASLRDYMVNASLCPFIAKDTSYFVSPLNASYGQNEKIFRKRFRN